MPPPGQMAYTSTTWRYHSAGTRDLTPAEMAVAHRALLVAQVEALPPIHPPIEPPQGGCPSPKTAVAGGSERDATGRPAGPDSCPVLPRRHWAGKSPGACGGEGHRARGDQVSTLACFLLLCALVALIAYQAALPH